MEKKNFIRDFLELDRETQIHLLRYNQKLFDCETLIKLYGHRHDSFHYGGLARELALKKPIDELNYETLIKLSKSNNSEVRDISMEIALKNFAKKFSAEDLLIESEKTNGFTVRNLIIDVAREIPSDQLNYTILIRFKKSKHEAARKLADLLICKIPFEKRDYKGKEYIDFIEKYKS